MLLAMLYTIKNIYEQIEHPIIYAMKNLGYNKNLCKKIKERVKCVRGVT